MKKHKTGIFSGSFNPIHIGHLALANYLCEYEGLDEIWFMVSPQNPLKTQSELWSDGLRLKLVELSTTVIRIFKLRISSFTATSLLQRAYIGKATRCLSRTGLLFHYRL